MAVFDTLKTISEFPLQSPQTTLIPHFLGHACLEVFDRPLPLGYRYILDMSVCNVSKIMIKHCAKLGMMGGTSVVHMRDQRFSNHTPI